VILEGAFRTARSRMTRREQNVIDLTLNSAEGVSWPLALVNQR
jgi:hypothetical protein